MAAATFTFDEIGHLYRDAEGIVVPSVTQALKASGLINFDGINPQVLERKRQLGVLVHKAAELYDRGESLEEFEIPELVTEYLEGYINFRFDCGFVSTLIEERQLGEIHGMVFGMQPDRAGLINDALHVLELKCGSATHPAWGVQLAAYATGKYGRGTKVKRAAVQLGLQFPRGYQLHSYEDPADYQLWDCSLALTIWQQNKGILKLDDIPERLIAV